MVRLLWYKIGTLLYLRCGTSVLSQHPLIGSQSYASDALGYGQGGSVEAGPDLRRQVQNFATRGMVGSFIIILSEQLFYQCCRGFTNGR